MRKLFRLMASVAALGFGHAAGHDAAAADIDAAYLRGSDGSAAAPAAPVYEIVPASPAWTWTGVYGGAHAGATAGTANIADPFGPSMFGDAITTPGFLGGGQVGFSWQLPNSGLVLGAEADASWLGANGTNTCLAFSAFFVSANCRAQPSMLGDLTARVGWAYGRFDHSLLYIKGGAALVRNQIDITTNGTAGFGLAPLATSSSFTKVGWTAGAGAEHAITPAWSVRIEYGYVGIGGQSVATPQGLVQVVPGVNAYNFTAAGTARATQNFQEVNLGLNYKFGMDPTAQWGVPVPVLAVETPVVAAIIPAGWELEAGVRYWYSNGTFQKDLTPPSLVSRLTYSTAATSGEIFGRIESPQNLFLKGNVGVGSLVGGRMNDEDWAIFGGAVAYSNTLSAPVTGTIDYATVDAGYDFFRGAGYRLGAFVGYNYYKSGNNAYGCTQIANPFSDCVPAIPGSFLGITENDTWNSLRLGANGEIMIADRLKLGADVAYLPYVAFSGVDDHLGWNPVKVFPESANAGQGVQLETILSYAITDQFSVGMGGRYWAMWTQNGQYTLATQFYCGGGCPNWPADFKTQQYGVFVQLDYRAAGSLLAGFR